jgi:hypothetical protein
MEYIPGGLVLEHRPTIGFLKVGVQDIDLLFACHKSAMQVALLL